MSDDLEVSVNPIETVNLTTEEAPKKLLNITPFILLSGALLAVAMAPIFIKISVSKISANATLFHRLWIETLVFGVWSGFEQIQEAKTENKPIFKPSYQMGDIALLIAVGLVELANRLLFTWSITQTSIANATMLSSLTPLFTTLGTWILLGQSFQRKFLVGLALATLGAIAIGWTDIQNSTNTVLGDAAALTSAFLCTGNLLILEKIHTKFLVSTILVWRCAIGALFMLPLVLTFDKQIFPISTIGWISVISLAAISESLGHGLLIYSFRNFSAAFIALFFLLDPVIAGLLAWFIFAESLGILNIIALLVILIGIYLVISDKGSVRNQNEEF